MAEFRRDATRELGRPTSGGAIYGGLGGFLAAILTGILLAFLGELRGLAAEPFGLEQLWIAWGTYLVAGLVLGAAYGALVATWSVPRGVLYGAGFGVVVGALLGLATADLLIGAIHVLWGALLGAIQAWGYRGSGRAPVKTTRRVRVG